MRTQLVFSGRFWVACLLCIALSGCFIGPSRQGPALRGDIRVGWVFEGAALCPDDVDNVVVQIEGMSDEIVPCSKGSLVLSGLDVGTYRIQLKGIVSETNGEYETWDSSGEEIIVVEGKEVTVEFDLSPLP